MSKNLRRALDALEEMEFLAATYLGLAAYTEFIDAYNELLAVVEKLEKKAKRKKKSAPVVVDESYQQIQFRNTSFNPEDHSPMGFSDIKRLAEKAWPGEADEWLNTYNHFLGMTPSTAYVLEGPGRVIEALSHDINTGNYLYPKGTK